MKDFYVEYSTVKDEFLTSLKERMDVCSVHRNIVNLNFKGIFRC